MPTTSTNLGLALYNATSDQAEYFSDFRADLAGEGGGSNMNLIDVAYKNMADDITDLQAKKGVIPVSAAYISANYYEATVAAITAYETDMVIGLVLDTDSDGTVTLKINSLATKSLNKINASGSLINLNGHELRSGRMNLFVYTGSVWKWISATSSDQIDVIGGTEGNILSVDANGNPSDSGIGTSGGVIDASAIPPHASATPSDYGAGTKSVLGHVQAGDGVAVASGVISADVDGSSIVLGGASPNKTIQHADTSSQADVTNTGVKCIQSVGVDGYGHVDSLASVVPFEISAAESGNVAVGGLWFKEL